MELENMETLTPAAQLNQSWERNIFTAYSHKLCKANVIENISLKNIGFRNLILNKRAKL